MTAPLRGSPTSLRARAGRLFAPLFVVFGLIIFGLWMVLRTGNPIWVVLALPLGVGWLIYAAMREVRISAQGRPPTSAPGSQ